MDRIRVGLARRDLPLAPGQPLRRPRRVLRQRGQLHGIGSFSRQADRRRRGAEFTFVPGRRILRPESYLLWPKHES